MYYKYEQIILKISAIKHFWKYSKLLASVKNQIKVLWDSISFQSEWLSVRWCFFPPALKLSNNNNTFYGQK